MDGLALQFLFRSFLDHFKRWSHRGKKNSKCRHLRTRGIVPNNFWTNWASAKLIAPSKSPCWYASKYVYHDLIRPKSRDDLSSRDLNPRPCRGDATPPVFFLRCTPNYEVDRAEILHSLWGILCATFGKKFWPGHVRSRSYDVTRGTRSGHFCEK